jgi:hypothetical protein
MNKKVNVWNALVYYPVNTEVIGVVGDEILIKGTIIENDTDKEYDDITIIVKLDTYKQMMNEWIEEKKDYCERFEYMCGFSVISGNGNISEKLVFGEEYFDCTEIEFCVDMEHG